MSVPDAYAEITGYNKWYNFMLVYFFTISKIKL